MISSDKQRKMFARYKSCEQILETMYKTLRIVFPLILAAFLLPACNRKQSPTPADTVLGRSGSGSGYDIIPDGSAGDDSWALQSRAGEGIEDGYYNGRQMVTGVLPSVYFSFDSSSVSAAERSKLQQAADHLMANPSDGLLVEGHCDWYGTAEYNLALGDRRANSVRDYLTTLGISPDRIETLSKGSLEATSGLSKELASEDRRADLIILK